MAENEILETEEREQDFGIAGIINQSVLRHWELIDWYNSVVATLATLELDDQTKEVLDEIQCLLTEEYGNFAVLEKLSQKLGKSVSGAVDELLESGD